HDHHRLRSAVADKFKGGFAGEEAVFIRFGVAAQKVLEVQSVRGRSGKCGNDTAQVCAARQDGQEASEHAVCGFADGEDTDVRETAKVVATLGTAEIVAGAGQTAFDGCARINGCEGAAENFAGAVFRVHRFGGIGREGDKGGRYLRPPGNHAHHALSP